MRVRVVVTAHDGPGDGLVAEHQKQVFVHDDPQLVAGYPIHVEGAGTSSPCSRSSTGHRTRNSYWRPTTVGSRRSRKRPTVCAASRCGPRRPRGRYGSPTAQDARIAPPGNAIRVGAPVGRPRPRRTPEVVVDHADGDVSAWEAHGDVQEGSWPVGVDPPTVATTRRPATSTTGRSAASCRASSRGPRRRRPARDRRRCARPPRLRVARGRAGRSQASPCSSGPGQGHRRRSVTDYCRSRRCRAAPRAANSSRARRSPTSPATAGRRSDRRTGAVRRDAEHRPRARRPHCSTQSVPWETALYAISPEGTKVSNADRNAAHPEDQAYLPGWPVSLAMLQLEALPTIGDGVATRSDRRRRGPAPAGR